MSKSLFITATGTDIGKTYVSGLIVKKMRDYGFNCGYFKPVLSGAVREPDGDLVPGDCKFVLENAGICADPMESLSYCFEEAVSPHLAAKRAGVVIKTDKIIEDYTNYSRNYDYTLIEGAGGITCPIREENGSFYLLSNLVKDLNQNVVIVADGGLGTINSVITTVEYIKNRNINIKGVILNNFNQSDFMHRDNLDMIEKLTDIKVVATVEKGQKDINMEKNVIENLFE